MCLLLAMLAAMCFRFYTFYFTIYPVFNVRFLSLQIMGPGGVCTFGMNIIPLDDMSPF
jgi:hypothetical protein